jgi:hypothetical protein
LFGHLGVGLGLQLIRSNALTCIQSHVVVSYIKEARVSKPMPISLKQFMKSKIVNFLIYPAILLIGADIFFSALSNNKIKNENYFINQRLANATLGSGYNELLDCQVDVMFYFYTYKTCFIRRTQRGDKDWSYRFLYARPFPVFLSFMNNLRFEMIGTGTANFLIFSDGTIEEVT